MNAITPTHEEIGSLVPKREEAKPDVKPLNSEDDLYQFFLSLFSKCEKQDDKEWREIKRQMVRAAKYFDGKMYGYVDNNFAWIDYEKRPGEVTYKDNIYHAHIMTALTELVKGEPELSFTATVEDDRIAQQAAKIAETRYKTHRQRLFDAGKLQQEKLTMLLKGMGVRYTFFDRTKYSQKMPVFGEKRKNTVDSGVTVCADCYAKKEGQEPCPTCGSTEVTQLKSEGISAKAVTGYDSVPGGENNWIPVDPLGITFDLQATSVKNSAYWIWKQSVLTDVLQAKYPEIKIDDGVTQDLDLQAEISQATPNSGYLNDGKSKKDRAEFSQGWFDPALYAHRKIKATVKLRNGAVLQQGKTLGDYFPDGLYLAKNMNTLLDVWNEDKCSKWTATPYVTRLGTLVGAGTSVALDNQDIKNDLRNLHMASIMHDAFAKEFVNTQYIEGDEIPDDPRERAHVSGLPQGTKIVGEVIDRMPGTSLTPDAYAMEERIDASMQMQLGTFSGTSLGSPDLQAVKNTASAFLAWRNMTIGRYAPMLAAAADALDKEQAYQFLENDQKNLTPRQWEKLKGDFGGAALKVFLNCNIREDIIVEVVGESYMPTDSATKTAKAESYLTIVSQAQLDPHSEMGAYMAERYGMPKSLVGFDAQKNATYESIYALKNIADGIASQTGDIPTYSLQDPIAMQMGMLIVEALNKPVQPDLDDTNAIVDTLREYWQTDACRNGTNMLKAALLMYQQSVSGAMVAKAQQDMQMQMAAQEPMMEAQAQAAQQAGESERAAQEDERSSQEDERNAQATGKLMDLEEADKQRSHDASEREKDRELEREKIKAQAKAKPKKAA